MRTVRSRVMGGLCLGLLSVLAPLGGSAQEPGELLTAAMYNDLATAEELILAGVDLDQRNEYGHTPLIIAANYGHEQMARLLVSEGADVTVQGEDGGTALLAAASNSQPLVELLLDHGADIDARMADGTGVLTRCTVGILRGRVTLDLASLLLAEGAAVDESATGGALEGYTPLMMAARNNHEALVRFLIENGADVHASAGDGSTPLSLAAAEGHQGIVEILEAAGRSAPRSEGGER